MIYITGDTHGSYSHIRKFCKRREQPSPDDLMIVLGDTMLNYYGDERDVKQKEKVAAIGIDFLFLHGNHDMRPAVAGNYELIEWNGGLVYAEKEYPQLLFACDGERYRLEGKDILTVGGAYSVDKEYRLTHGYHWFADEQPSPQIKEKVMHTLADLDWTVDYMISHTCPLSYLPREALFASVDQSKVDQSTELWLDQIEQRLTYKQWYCGHFHINKAIDRIQFLYRNFIPFILEQEEK